MDILPIQCLQIPFLWQKAGYLLWLELQLNEGKIESVDQKAM